MDLDNLVQSEINLIESKSNSLVEISKLLLEVTSIPVTLLTSFQVLVDQIKNNDISQAINSLELSLIEINKINQNLLKSIQILKQES